MLRSDHVRAIEFIINEKRNAADIRRGKIDMDAAGFAASGYAFADAAFLGTVLGLKLQRDSALADNHLNHVDELESTTYETTLLIGGAGAGEFTNTNLRYTEAGACGVFTSGEIVNVTGATKNNGTYLTTGIHANYVVLGALPGESDDVADDAALTGVTFT